MERVAGMTLDEILKRIESLCDGLDSLMGKTETEEISEDSAADGAVSAPSTALLLGHLEEANGLEKGAEALGDAEGVQEVLVDLGMIKAGIYGLLIRVAEGDYEKQREYSLAELEVHHALDKLQPMNPLVKVKISEIYACLAGIESHLDSSTQVVLQYLEKGIEGYMSQIEMDPAVNNTYYQSLSLNGLAEAVANQVNILSDLDRGEEGQAACQDFLSFAQAVQESDFPGEEFPDLSDFLEYLEEAE